MIKWWLIDFIGLRLYIRLTRRLSYKKQKLLKRRKHLGFRFVVGPFLMSFGKSSNDYINAVIIPVSTLMLLLYSWVHSFSNYSNILKGKRHGLNKLAHCLNVASTWVPGSWWGSNYSSFYLFVLLCVFMFCLSSSHS
jgi:hypothetical protein